MVDAQLHANEPIAARSLVFCRSLRRTGARGPHHLQLNREVDCRQSSFVWLSAAAATVRARKVMDTWASAR